MIVHRVNPLAPYIPRIEITGEHALVWSLFRSGLDTVDIAERINATEAKAFRLLDEAREAKRRR